MIDLASLIEERPEGLFVRSRGLSVSEIAGRFLRSETIDGTTPAEVIAALTFEALGPEGSKGPSLVRGKSSRSGLRKALEDSSLSKLIPDATRPARLALSAGLFQAFDDWEASHEAAQEADDLGERDSAAYWHGIAHRREPDPGNAAYWFRRVGRHAAFGPLAKEAGAILDAAKLPANRIFRGDSWDANAFVDFCSSARPGSIEEDAARKIQRAEMRILMGISAGK